MSEPLNGTADTPCAIPRILDHGYGNPLTHTPPYIEVPVMAGGYRLGPKGGGSVTFMLAQKPSAWKRFWVRATLGWTWDDLAEVGA